MTKFFLDKIILVGSNLFLDFLNWFLKQSFLIFLKKKKLILVFDFFVFFFLVELFLLDFC